MIRCISLPCLSFFSFSFFGMTLLTFVALPGLAAEPMEKKFAIVIHGGAGGNPDNWSEEYRQARRDGLAAALDRGVEMLAAGDAAMDVVEQVVHVLEDDEHFNAGRGCVLNENGEHELDACIMDGKDLRCGAVAGVTTVKNPITLARKVMTDTRHILLFGNGAEQFAQLMKIEQAPADYFRTESQKRSWEKWKAKQTSTSQVADKPEAYFGTVGCVVVDQQGNLAAATSTGGLMGKRWGRVGDTPIVGAGNYADNATCAVSGTGIGEEFIRHNVGSDIAAQMRYASSSLADAAKATLAKLPEDCGGVIAVDAQGNIVMEFNTLAMSRAYADSNGHRGVYLAREDE